MQSLSMALRRYALLSVLALALALSENTVAILGAISRGHHRSGSWKPAGELPYPIFFASPVWLNQSLFLIGGCATVDCGTQPVNTTARTTPSPFARSAPLHTIQYYTSIEYQLISGASHVSKALLPLDRGVAGRSSSVAINGIVYVTRSCSWSVSDQEKRIINGGTSAEREDLQMAYQSVVALYPDVPRVNVSFFSVPLSRVRVNASCVAMGNQIYIVGGVFIGTGETTTSVDGLDVVSKRYQTDLAKLEEPVMHPSVISTAAHTLIIVGGLRSASSGGAAVFSSRISVLLYDATTPGSAPCMTTVKNVPAQVRREIVQDPLGCAVMVYGGHIVLTNNNLTIVALMDLRNRADSSGGGLMSALWNTQTRLSGSPQEEGDEVLGTTLPTIVAAPLLVPESETERPSGPLRGTMDVRRDPILTLAETPVVSHNTSVLRCYRIGGQRRVRRTNKESNETVEVEEPSIAVASHLLQEIADFSTVTVPVPDIPEDGILETTAGGAMGLIFAASTVQPLDYRPYCGGRKHVPEETLVAFGGVGQCLVRLSSRLDCLGNAAGTVDTPYDGSPGGLVSFSASGASNPVYVCFGFHVHVPTSNPFFPCDDPFWFTVVNPLQPLVIVETSPAPPHPSPTTTPDDPHHAALFSIMFVLLGVAALTLLVAVLLVAKLQSLPEGGLLGGDGAYTSLGTHRSGASVDSPRSRTVHQHVRAAEDMIRRNGRYSIVSRVGESPEAHSVVLLVHPRKVTLSSEPNQLVAVTFHGEHTQPLPLPDWTHAGAASRTSTFAQRTVLSHQTPLALKFLECPTDAIRTDITQQCERLRDHVSPHPFLLRPADLFLNYEVTQHPLLGAAGAVTAGSMLDLEDSLPGSSASLNESFVEPSLSDRHELLLPTTSSHASSHFRLSDEWSEHPISGRVQGPTAPHAIEHMSDLAEGSSTHPPGATLPSAASQASEPPRAAPLPRPMPWLRLRLRAGGNTSRRYLCVVTPYAPHGNLHRLLTNQKEMMPQDRADSSFLRGSRDSPDEPHVLSEMILCSVLYQVSSALGHLHAQSPPVVHGNLHTRNILLREPMGSNSTTGLSDANSNLRLFRQGFICSRVTYLPLLVTDCVPLWWVQNELPWRLTTFGPSYMPIDALRKYTDGRRWLDQRRRRVYDAPEALGSFLANVIGVPPHVTPEQLFVSLLAMPMGVAPSTPCGGQLPMLNTTLVPRSFGKLFCEYGAMRSGLSLPLQRCFLTYSNAAGSHRMHHSHTPSQTRCSRHHAAHPTAQRAAHNSDTLEQRPRRDRRQRLRGTPSVMTSSSVSTTPLALLQYAVLHDPSIDAWGTGALLLECIYASPTICRSPCAEDVVLKELPCRALVALLTDLNTLHEDLRAPNEAEHFHAPQQPSDQCEGKAAVAPDTHRAVASTATTTSRQSSCRPSLSTDHVVTPRALPTPSSNAAPFHWPACTTFEQNISQSVKVRGYSAGLAHLLSQLLSPLPVRRPLPSDLLARLRVKITPPPSSVHPSYSSTASLLIPPRDQLSIPTPEYPTVDPLTNGLPMAQPTAGSFDEQYASVTILAR